MAIPFLSPIKASGNIRLANSGKLFLWNDHDSNYLMYDRWRASASAGMNIQNVASTGEIYLRSNNALTLTLDGTGQGIFENYLGIGGNTPTVALDVKGPNNLSSRFIFTKDSTTDKILFGGADHDDFDTFVGSSSNHSFTITQNGAAAVTIDTSKNATFEGILDVNGTGNSTFAGDVIIDHSTNTDSTLKLHSYSSAIGDAYAWNLTAENSANGYAFRILQGTSEVFTIANTASGATLGNSTFAGDVTVGPKNNATVQVSESGGATVKMLAGSVGRIGTYTDDELRIVTDGNDRLTISNTGAATFAGNTQAPKFIAAQGSYVDGYQLTRAGHDTYRICLGNSHGLRIVNETDSSREELAFDGGGNATFAGTVTSAKTIISTSVGTGNPTPATDNVRFNGYGMIGNRGNLYITNSNSSGVVQIGIGGAHNGNPKLTIGGSTSHIRTSLLPGADSTYNIGSNVSRFSNIYADTLHGTVAQANNLQAFDDRDMAPEDLSYSDDLKLFFSAREGLEDGTSTGTDWHDVLVLNSYSDSSGGNANVLAFDKNSYKIRHYQAGLSASNWGTAKELAYTSDFVKRTGGTSTSMTGDLHIIAGAPKIYLQDSTDDDDQQIIFRNNGGSDEYKIATQDFTSAGTGDGLFIGSETTDPVKLVTNDTIALAIDSSQNVTFAGSITGKDNGIIIDSLSGSFGRIHGTSSIFLGGGSTTLVQLSSNLVPDGNNSRTLGTSGRYWGETFTSGVTSGGNIVINSNTPVLTLGVVNSSTGNSKIQFYSKNSGASNGFAIQYNKDTGIDRLEFIDGSGTANIKFNNGGAAEFAGSVTATQINTGQGATEVHLMNQNLRTTDDVTFDNLIVTGNITVTGDLNTVSVTDLDVSDKTITVGVGQSEANSGGSGLKVSGPSTQPSILWNESNDTWDFNYGIDVNGNINVDTQSTDILIGDNDSDALEVKQGSNLYMRFNTTNGGEKIEINKPVEATFINASTGFRMASGQAIDFVSTNIGYNSIERNTSVGGLQINTGGSASMNILDNGRVGIGVTSITDSLQVKSEGSDDGIALIKSNNTNQIIKLIETGTGDGALMAKNTSNSQQVLIRAQGNSYLNGGNVGIGTNSPTNKLHVAGTTSHTSAKVSTTTANANYVVKTNNSEFALIGQGSSNRFDIWDSNAGATRLSIDSSGEVGIGTTTPGQKLEVAGRIRVSSDPTIEFYEASNKRGGIQWSITNDYTNIFAVGGDIRFDIGGEKMRITSAGKVGIGTSSPAYKLDVNGGSIFIDSDWPLYLGSTSAFIEGNSTGTILRSNASAGFTWTDGGTTQMKLDTNGKLGIGKTPSQWILDVDSSDAYIGSFDGSNNTGVVLNSNNSTAAQIIGYSNSVSAYNDLDIRSNSTAGSGIYIDGSTSRVSIGTTSPLANLHVKSTSNTVLIIEGNQNTRFATLQLKNADQSWMPRLEGTSQDFVIRDDTAASEPFRIKPATSTGSNDSAIIIDGDANVGIGTTSPTYKLSVPSGGIEAGGKITYSKSAGSLNATGYAVAGITANANGNGSSCGFTFTCFGHTGAYQKIVYSCYNGSGTWYAKKVIDEGTNQLDVAASANGSTITFTFKATSSTMSYTPRVTVEATGHNINSTYA